MFALNNVLEINQLPVYQRIIYFAAFASKRQSTKGGYTSSVVQSAGSEAHRGTL